MKYCEFIRNKMQRTTLLLNVQQQKHMHSLARKWRDRKLLDIKELDTFHRSIKGCLFLGQLLGLMPLMNMLQSNPELVKFSPQAVTMVFTVLFLTAGTLKALYRTRELLLNGIDSKNIMGLFFFYTNLTICVCFLMLARNWPELLRTWTRFELRFLMPPYRNVWNRKYMPLHRKLPLFSAIFLSIAIVENSLYYSSEFINFKMKIMHCSANQTHSDSIIRMFLKSKYSDIFTVMPYNPVSIFYGFFLNANFNLIWNFSDLFIMLVSMALARRFQQYAAYVQTLQERHVPVEVWYDARRDHVQLCELLEYVDEKISHFVLISALNNTYFICNTLLNIFTKLRWTVNYVYFWFSLLFMLGRTSSVFLCASTIHEAGQLPLKILYFVPNSQWNEETERLAAQITSENISLTGKRFFNVTRKNLFGLMACIVTWELMLLQLDAPNWQQGLPDLCI